MALIDAVETAVPNLSLQLKWPNDLLLDGAKVAGILLERAGDRVVAGFGVNLAVAPEIPGRATAHLGAALAPKAFAPLLAASFARLLAAWRQAEPASLVTAWEQRAHPRGTPLAVHQGPGDLVEGAFDGLDCDGALRLRLADGGVAVVRAGDVELR